MLFDKHTPYSGKEKANWFTHPVESYTFEQVLKYAFNLTKSLRQTQESASSPAVGGSSTNLWQDIYIHNLPLSPTNPAQVRQQVGVDCGGYRTFFIQFFFYFLVSAILFWFSFLFFFFLVFVLFLSLGCFLVFCFLVFVLFLSLGCFLFFSSIALFVLFLSFFFAFFSLFFVPQI